MADFREFYDALVADGAPVPETYEKFKAYMTQPGKEGYRKRKGVYDALVADGAPVPETYEKFAASLFRPAGQTKAANAKAANTTTAKVSSPATGAGRGQAGKAGGPAAKLPETATRNGGRTEAANSAAPVIGAERGAVASAKAANAASVNGKGYSIDAQAASPATGTGRGQVGKSALSAGDALHSIMSRRAVSRQAAIRQRSVEPVDGVKAAKPDVSRLEIAKERERAKEVAHSPESEAKFKAEAQDVWENASEEQRAQWTESRLTGDYINRMGHLWDFDVPENGLNSAERAWADAESRYKGQMDENARKAYGQSVWGPEARTMAASENYFDNMASRMTAFDVRTMMDNAWENLGDDGQKKLVDYCYETLKRRYPGADDLALHTSAEEMARNESDMRLYALAVKKNMPQSALEFFGRKVRDANTVYSLGKGIARAKAGSIGDLPAYEAAMGTYGKEHKLLDVAGDVTGFMFDPMTWATGGFGGAMGKASLWWMGRAAAGKGATKLMTEAAVREMSAGLWPRIFSGMIGSSANLGMFEAGKAAENQFVHGGEVIAATDEDDARTQAIGYKVGDYSGTAVGKQLGHGMLMGAAIGWLGPATGNATDKLVRRTGSTAGKIGAKAGMFTGSVLAEGTIFSLPQMYELGEQHARGENMETSMFDVWKDNMLMIGGFKVQGMIKSAPKVIEEFGSTEAGRKGMESRIREYLDGRRYDGRLSGKDLALTNDERAELEDYGYNLNDMVREAGDISSEEMAKRTARGDLPETLSKLVQDPSVSEAARAKVYYYATGRMLPMSTIVRGELLQGEEQGYIVQSIGENGVITSRRFSTRKGADMEMERIDRQVELNRVETGEFNKQSEWLSGQMTDACRRVADANGWDAVSVYKIARKVTEKGSSEKAALKEAEEAVYKKVEEEFKKIDLSKMDSAVVEIRNGVNEKYGVDVDDALSRERNKRSDKEQAAVDEYISELEKKEGLFEIDEDAPDASDAPDAPGSSGPAAEPPETDGHIGDRGEGAEEAGASLTETEAVGPAASGSKYGPGYAVVREPDGSTSRVWLTGHVNEAGEHEYVVEGREVRYGTDADLDAIVESYEPYDRETTTTDCAGNSLSVGDEVELRTGYRGVVTEIDDDGIVTVDHNGQLVHYNDAYGDITDSGLRKVAPEAEPAEQSAAPTEPQGGARVPDGMTADRTISVAQRDGSTREYTVAKDQSGNQYVVDEQGFMWGHDGDGENMKPYRPGESVSEWTDEQIARLNQPAQPSDAVSEQPEIVPTEQPAAEPTPLQRVPKDAKGEPMFHLASDAETGWDALVESYAGDEFTAEEQAEMALEHAKAELEAARKAPSLKRGRDEDLHDFIKRKKLAEKEQANAATKWERIVAEAERRTEAARAEREAEAARLEAEARAEQEAQATEAKRATAMQTRNSRLSAQNMEEYKKRRQEEMEQGYPEGFLDYHTPIEELSMDEEWEKGPDPDDDYEMMLFDLDMPLDFEDAVMMGLIGRKITPESWNDQVGSNMRSERKRLPVGMIASREKGGVPFRTVAKEIWEDMEDYVRLQSDDLDVTNTMISLMMSGSGMSRRRFLDHRKELLSAWRSVKARRWNEEAMEEWCQATYGSHYSEAMAYERHRRKELEEASKDFDESEYNGILADEIAAREAAEGETKFEKDGREDKEAESSGVGESDGGGGEVLPAERSAEQSGERSGSDGKPGAEVGGGIEGDGQEGAVPTGASGGRREERGDGRGGIVDDEHSAGIDAGGKALLDTVGHQLGINIRFAPREEIGGTNAKYNAEKREIVIASDYVPRGEGAGAAANRIAQTVFGHEVTHHLRQECDPGMWGAFRSAVIEAMGRESFAAEVARARAAYDDFYDRRGWKRLGQDEIEEEVLVEAAGRMLMTDEAKVREMLDRVAESGESSATVARRVLDWIRDMIARLRASVSGRVMTGEERTYMERLEDMRKTWEGMYEYAAAKEREFSEARAEDERPGAEDAEGPAAKLPETDSRISERLEDTEAEASSAQDPGRVELNVASAQDPGRVELNVASAKDPGSRAYMREVLEQHGFDRAEMDDLFGLLDGIGDEVMRIAKKNPQVRQWQIRPVDRREGTLGLVPKLGAFINNGDYDLNIDLGTLCTKREALDHMMKLLVDEGFGQNMGPTQLAALRDLLKKYGYLVQCDVCFVETKRARMLNQANDLTWNWNAVCDAIGVDSETVLGKGTLTDEQRVTLGAIARGDVSSIAAEKMRSDKAGVDYGLTAANAARIAKLMLEDGRMAGRMNAERLLTTADTDELLKEFSGTGLPNYIASFQGAATAKPMRGFRTYDPLSWRERYDYADAKTPEERLKRVLGIGGVRMQSFSDFNPMLFFDYVQLMADLQARRLPLHTYTKVPAFVELFGETGAMINMSLVPDVDKSLGKEYAGLKRDADGNLTYAWVDESFPPERAFELRTRPEYGGRVGTIAIGISDKQIRMMLDDDRIDMVIPFHSSGMDANIKVKTGLDYATDYQDYQETKFASEEARKKAGNFSFNEAMQRLGDPRAAAEEYLEWCRKNGATPKFAQFADHRNYYKLLEDFRTMNGETPVVQGGVKLKLPENYVEIWQEAMKERGYTSQAIEGMSENEDLMQEARKIMEPVRIDGDIRKRFMIHLRNVLGSKNVESLRQEEFDAALDAAYRQSGMSAEESRSRIQELRDANGIIYGFAQGRKITLNENVFNANTPAHEYGHIWAKVVAKSNPKLWERGLKLLKSDAGKIWDEVVNDEFYAGIAEDENAVASEVLSRLLGRMNEERIGELNDSAQKRLGDKGITQRIMDWLREIWSEIRDTFGDNLRGLTFEEFVNMPMRDLYDKKAGLRFRRKANAVFRAEQKASAQDAAAAAVANQVEHFIGKKARAQYEALLDKKRPDLPVEKRNEALDYLHSLEDTKENNKRVKTAVKWLADGTIRLPEDMRKVDDALSVAEKAKVDPMQYGSPMELLDAHKDFKPTRKPIDPETVPTLSKAYEIKEQGIVVYDVYDDTENFYGDGSYTMEESRQAMREIINTHFGDDCSPWCLLQGDGHGNLSEESERYWHHYDAVQKQVAFQNGKLIAFRAIDDAMPDESTMGKRVGTLLSEEYAEGLEVTFDRGRGASVDYDAYDVKSVDKLMRLADNMGVEYDKEAYEKFRDWLVDEESHDEDEPDFDFEAIAEECGSVLSDLGDDEYRNILEAAYENESDPTYALGVETWWDRQDASHVGIPATIKTAEGWNVEMEYNPVTGKVVKQGKQWKGKQWAPGRYEEYDERGDHTVQIHDEKGERHGEWTTTLSRDGRPCISTEVYEHGKMQSKEVRRVEDGMVLERESYDDRGRMKLQECFHPETGDLWARRKYFGNGSHSLSEDFLRDGSPEKKEYVSDSRSITLRYGENGSIASIKFGNLGNNCTIEFSNKGEFERAIIGSVLYEKDGSGDIRYWTLQEYRTGREGILMSEDEVTSMRENATMHMDGTLLNMNEEMRELAEADVAKIRPDDGIRYREGEDEEGKIYSEEEVSRRFDEQLERHAKEGFRPGEVYQLGKPSEKLVAAGFPAEQPIELSASHLDAKSKQRNHPFDISELKGLVDSLRNPLAVFPHGNPQKALNAIVELRHGDDNFLVGVHFSHANGGKMTASIRGVFPKYNTEWLSWIENGKAIGLDKARLMPIVEEMRDILSDKEKTEKYLSPRFTGGDLTDINLDLVANIINNFGKNKGEVVFDEIENSKDVMFRTTEKEAFAERRPAAEPPETATHIGDLKTAEPEAAREREAAAEALLHEEVSRRGLREIAGADGYSDFLRGAYSAAGDDIRRVIVERARDNGWDFERATEDYLAELARKDFADFGESERALWLKLRDCGLAAIDGRLGDGRLGDGRLPSWAQLGDNELRYMLRRGRDATNGEAQDYVSMAEDALLREETGVDSGDRFSIPMETDDIWKDRSIGLEERITGARIRLSNNQRGDVDLRSEAIGAVVENLQSLVHDMRNRSGRTSSFAGADGKVERGVAASAKAQRRYDRTTVKRVADLARTLMQEGYLDNMTMGETKRLVSVLKNATGAEDISGAVEKVVDIMISSQLRGCGEQLDALLRVKGSKVDARGVSVQGALDADGVRVIGSMKDGMGLSVPEIEKRLAEAKSRMGDSDSAIADGAALEYAGLEYALEYARDIAESKQAEKDLLAQLREKAAEHKAGRMSDDAYGELVEATEDAIRKNKIDRIEAYNTLTLKIAAEMGQSMKDAEAWRDAQVQRVREIQHYANSDMKGMSSDMHRGRKDWKDGATNLAAATLLAPLGTFEQMIRCIAGRKAADGEGYLYNCFIRGLDDARSKEIRGYRGKQKRLDEKVRAVFEGSGLKVGTPPHPVRTWGDLIRLERKLPKMRVDYYDQSAKEYREAELMQGNLLYIYMVDKMSDGRMKLRQMGITEDQVAEIADFLEPRLKAIGDWVQSEFLKETRNEYNETHKRMFGTSMAAIEDYFPLKILGDARGIKEDIDSQDSIDGGTSVITGAIKNRKVNSLALDVLNADALNVLLDHVAEMEHWNAYAELGRDMNTLLSYGKFRNRVKNLRTVYGSGDALWKRFKDTSRLAFGTYRKEVSDFDEGFLKVARGVTAAKVAFRLNTALKQMLSLPALIPDLSVGGLIQGLKDPSNPFKWCMENLPIFEERWKSRISGDPRLMKSERGWNDWRNNVVEIAGRWGMTPNAFIDAVICSVVAKTIYDTKYSRYIKDGYSEEAARKRAKQDASIGYNLSQQSNEGAYMSRMQANKDWLSVTWTVFRNSPMSYTRQVHDAARNLKRNLTPGKGEELKEFMTKQILRDWGFDMDRDSEGNPKSGAKLPTSEDYDRAETAAKRRRNRTIVRDVLRLLTYGYILPGLWSLGGYWLYKAFGDNEDEKKAMDDDILARLATAPLEGLAGGDIMSNVVAGLINGTWDERTMSKDMPLVQDMTQMLKKFAREGTELEGLNDIFNLIVQSGLGFNPATIENVVLGIIDACGQDVHLAHEAAIVTARILNCPESQLKKLYFDEIEASGEEASKMSPMEIAERYARTQVKLGRPIMPWTWDDEGAIAKRIEGRYGTKKMVEDRRDRDADKRDLALYSDYKARHKAIKAKIEEAKEIKKENYLAGAEAFGNLVGDPDYKVYKQFKAYDKWLTQTSGMWIKSKSGSEARLIEGSINAYRSAFVRFMESATPEARVSAMLDMERIKSEFARDHKVYEMSVKR